MKRLAIATCGLLLACSDRPQSGDTTHAAFVNTRWALTLGDIFIDDGYGVAIDSTGDVIVGGEFQGMVDFGKESLVAPNTAGFVTKRAGVDGSDRWSIVLAADGALAQVDSVAAASDDSLAISGTYASDLVIGQTELHGPPPMQSTDCFVAKLDPGGNPLWAHGFGAASSCDNDALSVGADGRVAMVGTYQGTLVFPNGTFTAKEPDPFLAMFDANGNLLWGAVGTLGMSVNSVAFAAADDVLTSGEIVGATTYQGMPLVANAGTSQYVARWTEDGQLMWFGQLGKSGVSQDAGPIVIDPDGNAILGAQIAIDGSSDAGSVINELDAHDHVVATVQLGESKDTTRALARLANGAIVTIGTSDRATLEAYRGGTLIDSLSFPENTQCGGCSDYVPDHLASAPGSLVLAGAVGASFDFGTGFTRFAGASDIAIVMFDTTQ